jgi:Holliday junction DNA helicase RuvB
MSDQPNRLVNPEPRPDDRLDQALRPKKLAEIIGQDQVKENLSILIDAARHRS